jgi:hypothetical protein
MNQTETKAKKKKRKQKIVTLLTVGKVLLV